MAPEALIALKPETAKRRTPRAPAVPPDPVALWRKYVSCRLPSILERLVGLAEEGNLPAIKIILEAEGLTDRAVLAPSEDNYPTIVAECCERIARSAECKVQSAK